MLKVKLLSPTAKAPTVAHPAEDLGYDIFSSETVTIAQHGHAVIPTGIAVECSSPKGEKMGALLRDKSSMAARRLVVTGGVIDSGYRGELLVLLTSYISGNSFAIKAGDKIAQVIPLPVLTGAGVMETDSLSASARGQGGFGSTGT